MELKQTFLTVKNTLQSGFFRITAYFRAHLWIRVCAVWMFYFLIFSPYLAFDIFSSLDDQFFNIRFSDIFREQGFSAVQHFDRIAFKDSQSWVSNLLFYVFLMSFTYFHPLEFGLKVYSVVAVASTFGGIYYFLSLTRHKRPFFLTFFVAALLISVVPLWRLFMGRSFVLAPLILLLELCLLISARYRWLFIITFAYFFWHTATFFFPLLIAGVYFIFWSANHGKFEYRQIMYPVAGIAAALIANILLMPGFLGAFREIIITVIDTVSPFRSIDYSGVSQGIEVYPTTLFVMFANMPTLMFLTIVCVVIEAKAMLAKSRKGFLGGDVTQQTLFMLTIIFLLGSLATSRMTDFFTIFAAVFVVYSLDALRRTFSWKVDKVLITGVFIALSFNLLSNELNFLDGMLRVPAYDRAEGSAKWLANNTRKDEIIFNPTMNFFPTFYLYNEGYNRVVVAMEPLVLYKLSPEKYWLWYNLSNYGIVCGVKDCSEAIMAHNTAVQNNDMKWYDETGKAAAQVVTDTFSSHYILTSTDFSALNAILEKSSRFELVYQNPASNYYKVYYVKDR